MILPNQTTTDAAADLQLPSLDDPVELYSVLNSDIIAIHKYENSRPFYYADCEDFQRSVLTAYEAAAHELNTAWWAYYRAFKQGKALSQEAETSGDISQETADAIAHQLSETAAAASTCENLMNPTLLALSSIKVMDDACGRWTTTTEGESDHIFVSCEIRNWPDF